MMVYTIGKIRDRYNIYYRYNPYIRWYSQYIRSIGIIRDTIGKMVRNMTYR